MKQIQIHEIYEHRRSIINNMREKVELDADNLLAMVDELSERATNMRGQGLTSFLQTREEFMRYVERLREEYIELLCTNYISVNPSMNKLDQFEYPK